MQVKVQEQAAGALRNLSMHSENKNKLVSLGCIPPTLIVLKSPEPRIQEQVCIHFIQAECKNAPFACAARCLYGLFTSLAVNGVLNEKPEHLGTAREDHGLRRRRAAAGRSPQGKQMQRAACR
jgi:hypothetical protein